MRATLARLIGLLRLPERLPDLPAGAPPLSLAAPSPAEAETESAGPAA
jgi:hypothetical protein